MDSVKLTNEQTILAAQALAVLIKVKRPMLGALKMRQLGRLLTARIEDYDAERRKLLTHYGAKNEDGSRKERDGKVLFADDDARDGFASALKELLACEWECPVVLTVKDFGGLDVEPGLLVDLGDLLEEPQDEAAKKPELVKDTEMRVEITE